MTDTDDFWARPDVRAISERASAAEKAGDHEAALAAWDELVAAFPGELGGWSARGRFLERRGRFEDALASFRRSVAIRPTYPDHYNAATMLLQLGRLDEALGELDASIACNAQYAPAWCNRGIVLTRLERREDARASFERAEAVDDRLANAFRCHAILLQSLGELDGVARKRKRVSELEPNNAGAHLDYARALGDAHDDQQIHWEPDGVEALIVAAIDAALALGVGERQLPWAWAEKVRRLQRIAHGRQSARRAGLANVDDAGAIARYAEAAGAAVQRFPGDAWFQARADDARELAS